jgi:two-component system LytT family response regulator
MVKAIIIDDETHCSETLHLLLNEYCPQVTVIGEFNLAKAGLEALQKWTPDLLFLDIEMPVMNGFQLLEQFKELPFAVIFTTSYDQYAIRAFRFSALDYLLKPVDADDLQQAVQKAARQLAPPLPQQLEILLQKLHQPVTGIQKIAVPTMEGLQMIGLDAIISCASDSNYTTFFLKNNQKLIASQTLKDVEAVLEEHPFLRVHHSYVVNLNEVVKYVKGVGGYLLMSDGTTIDVSRSRKDALLKKLLPAKYSA